MKCDCGNDCKRQGTYRKNDKLIPRYKCLKCGKYIKKERKYKRLNTDEIELIFKLRRNKMELRKIAKVLDINVNSVVYQLKKNGLN